ncbi:MAG: hypothetical protein ACXVB9_09300 [Bdellovibrionota bacterium]
MKRSSLHRVLKDSVLPLAVVGWLAWTGASFGDATPADLGPGVVLREHHPPAEATNCKNCHAPKSKLFIKSRKDPQLEHRYFNTHHGKGAIACGSCHDANRQNQLNPPATFSNPSPVCARCHVEIYRDWKTGIHGKRLGGWNLPKTQLNCVDCHDPHSVSFPKMEAMPPPHKPPLHRDKEE